MQMLITWDNRTKFPYVYKITTINKIPEYKERLRQHLFELKINEWYEAYEWSFKEIFYDVKWRNHENSERQRNKKLNAKHKLGRIKTKHKGALRKRSKKKSTT